ncbi:MAG: HYR domain-containing protein, partial [Bacteroidota bacterium]
ATLSVSPSSFTCANVGANTVTLTVTDNNGNIKTATATVTVSDTVRPVATAQNITTYLNAAGTSTITASQVNNGSTDACGIATLSVSPSSFTCANVGANTVTLTVTDNNGNIKTATATVTVSDTVRPVVVTQNKTIYLNGAGSASVTAAQINNGSTDACGVATVALSQTAFTCSNTGANTVTLTVTDVNGNIKTGNATVTVLDTIKPIVVCKADTAILDATGNITIAPDSVKASASDNCSIASASLSKTTFNTTNIGNNSVVLTITDASGNVSTCTTNVLVIEPKPVAICQNATVYLNASGSGTLTVNQVDNGSYSLVGIASRVLSKTSFNCTDLGTNSVKLTVTNTYNNSDSCTSTVTVLDTIKPTVITKTYTTYLNASGTASITAANIDNNSTDNCGVASTVASKTSFNCSNVGSNTVWLIVADASGRKDSASTTVTILDTIKPTVNIQNSVVLYLNQTGSINITPSQFNNGSTDNCSIASTSITPTTITCADLGVKNVTLKVTDVNGNIDSATTSVIVLDPIAPVARPKANLTVYLSTNGQAVINPSLLDSASTDNCSITSRVLSQSVFNCSNIGNNTISFTVQDQSGNANAASVIITVLDTISPIATVSNQSLYLNASGTASITAAQVNNNSTDNCGVATIAINKTSFSCADLGSSNIIFTVTDINGNSKTASVNVNVFDTIRPVMRPKQFISAYLNTSGTATITVAGVDSASSDNCNIASKTLSQSTFTCANVGINTVTLTGTDSTGNTSGKAFTVTIIDTITPLLSTKPATIYLNATGNVTLSPTQVILSSSDNCSITSSSLSQSSFNCTNLGTNTVNITVTDASSNSKTLSASVTVLDTIKPTVITQNKTIYLNASGNASLTAAQVNNGSTDNCAIQTTSISKTTYTAVDLGINTITFTATDASSNSQTVNVTVTVLDTTRPIVITQNLTLYLNNVGTATVTAAQINNGSSDNAGINTLLLSKTSFNCNDIGTNTVTLSVSDVSNNTANANAVITVLDTIKPTIVAQNISVYLNGLGLATVTAQQANNGSTDNCGISNVTLSKTNFGCTERGINNAILTVSDASGNTVTTVITITVLDTIKPNVVVNNNLNLYLNATGNVSLTTAQVNNGSTDNCGITTLALSKTSFNGTNLGLNIINFTATDASGNSQTVSLNVSILDTVRPIVIAQDKTIYLNNSGNAVLTAAEVNNGSTDNVGINNISINKTLFNCNDAGTSLVEFTASDVSGNRSSAIVNVTVLDTIKPVVTFMPTDVVFGHCGANYRYIVPTATDNCGEVRIYQTEGVALGNTYPVGITTNVFTFTDKAGNVVTRSFKVTVLPPYLPDTFPSMAVCSSVPAFDLTRGNSNVIFSGSGVSVDGKTFDPSLSGAGNFHITFIFTDTTSCETKGTFVVTVYRAPDKPIIVRMNADVLQVQQIFHSYQWYRNGVAIPGATNQAYTMTRSGVYSVVVGTNQGCSTASDPLGVGVPVGVNNVTEQVKFSIHPNPSSGLFTIDIEGISGKQTNIIVYDALGKQIKEVATHTFTTDLDLTDLAPGTYYVRLNQDNKTSLKPIIIAK